MTTTTKTTVPTTTTKKTTITKAELKKTKAEKRRLGKTAQSATGKKNALAMKKAGKGIFAKKSLSEALSAICGAKSLARTEVTKKVSSLQSCIACSEFLAHGESRRRIKAVLVDSRVWILV